MPVTEKPRIEAYIGASGSGKGVSIERRLGELKPRRLLIWDPRSEYQKHARAVSLRAAVQAVAAAGDGPFALRVIHDGQTPPAGAFGVVCKLAFRAGRVLLLAEELSDVTTATHAPAAWRQCITQGRHQGLHIIGAAQRPALIDKTFLGNCTYIRCFTLRYEADRRTMAQALDVDQAQVNALQTTEEPGRVVIRYIERDFRARVLRPGQLTLKTRPGAT